MHRQASVTIIIGSTKRHWPNWRRSAERFAFGIAAQLRAATRDFPVHDRLHASQTPKGCSFTGLPPPAGMGSPYRMDDEWAAGDSDATTRGRRGETRHDGTMVGGRGVGRAHCGYSKTNIRLGQVESFPGWKLAWKSAMWFVRERRELWLAFRSTSADRLVPHEFRLARLYGRRVIRGFWDFVISTRWRIVKVTKIIRIRKRQARRFLKSITRTICPYLNDTIEKYYKDLKIRQSSRSGDTRVP